MWLQQQLKSPLKSTNKEKHNACLIYICIVYFPTYAFLCVYLSIYLSICLHVLLLRPMGKGFAEEHVSIKLTIHKLGLIHLHVYECVDTGMIGGYVRKERERRHLTFLALAILSAVASLAFP